MKNYLLFLVLFISISLYGQEKQISTSRVQYLVDYHYNFGFFEGGGWADINRGDYKMYGNSLHFTAMYNINYKLALGAGVGMDRYENPGFNSLPLFLSCHFAPLNKFPKAYVYSNLGYSLDVSDFVPGLLFDFGFGYKKMFKKHFGLNFQLGYNLKQRKDRMPLQVDPDHTIKREYDQTRHSVSVGVGLIF